jgi:ketosteroid isomerase-like protein
VVLEVEWTGTLSVPLGSLPAGGQMRARFAVFLDFRDGKIAQQRNYDCFQPW